MPLHAITCVHGGAGLGNGCSWGSQASLPRIWAAADLGRRGSGPRPSALALASRLHAQDWRQRELCAGRLLRVTIRILSHYRVAGPDVACAALRHDAVEDHAAGVAPGGRQAALTLLAGRFGAHRCAGRRGHQS
jgi:hypothetical protein